MKALEKLKQHAFGALYALEKVPGEEADLARRTLRSGLAGKAPAGAKIEKLDEARDDLAKAAALLEQVTQMHGGSNCDDPRCPMPEIRAWLGART